MLRMIGTYNREAIAYLIVSLVALVASVLTFYSGFGLGTLLLPAFALFFPVEVAIAATAVVHLANNLFKTGLVGKYANWPVVLRFGLPAIPAAFLGAWVLARVSTWPPVFAYHWAGHTFSVMPVKLLVAALMAVFSLLELVGQLAHKWPLWMLSVLLSHGIMEKHN